MRVITLTKGFEAIVDDDMYLELVASRWYYSNGYAVRDKSGEKREIMHRRILGVAPGQVVDHINRDKLDNRRENLRVCSRHQNAFNRSVNKNNRSGFKGVCYHKVNKRWCAYIRFHTVHRYLGSFGCPVEAARAYNAAASDLFGEFAFLNDV